MFVRCCEDPPIDQSLRRRNTTFTAGKCPAAGHACQAEPCHDAERDKDHRSGAAIAALASLTYCLITAASFSTNILLSNTLCDWRPADDRAFFVLTARPVARGTGMASWVRWPARRAAGLIFVLPPPGWCGARLGLSVRGLPDERQSGRR